jgi:hypothetical protein
MRRYLPRRQKQKRLECFADAGMQEHHGEYEPTAPKHHWSGWYAAYIAARQERKTPEEAATLGKLYIEGAQ